MVSFHLPLYLLLYKANPNWDYAETSTSIRHEIHPRVSPPHHQVSRRRSSLQLKMTAHPHIHVSIHGHKNRETCCDASAFFSVIRRKEARAGTMFQCQGFGENQKGSSMFQCLDIICSKQFHRYVPMSHITWFLLSLFCCFKILFSFTF